MIKPKILVSRCLGFDTCRYDGATLKDKFIERLSPFVEFITVCPEVQIGMSVPREAVRIVKQHGTEKLLASKSGTDFTEKMQTFSTSFLTSLSHIDGVIVKHRSPSCGFKDVKTYPTVGKTMVLGEKTAGFFGREILQHFPNTAIEDDGRLKNLLIREHFLTAVFTNARFQEVKQTKKNHDLITFHSQHKYLFMSYSPNSLKKMGKLVANIKQNGWDNTIENYEIELGILFRSLPQKGRVINTIEHIYGYFSDQLSENEKAFYFILKDQYLNHKIILSVLQVLLQSWSLRFQQKYIEMQYFFEAFPPALLNLSDSGK